MFKIFRRRIRVRFVLRNGKYVAIANRYTRNLFR